MPETIAELEAREVLGGSGRPTVEVQLTTTGGVEVVASVPSGTSKGDHEAFELYDGGRRFGGYGVRNAVANVNTQIRPAVLGMDVTGQRELDDLLLRLDGTGNKSRLGVNSVLPVSVACAKAGATASRVPCYRYLGGAAATVLPIPAVTVIAGGAHSPSSLEFEDYILIFRDFPSFGAAVEAVVETHSILGRLCRERFGTVPEVGAALAPPIRETRQAFDLMLESAERAGLAGRVALGLDVVASDLFDPDALAYRIGGRLMSPSDVVRYLAGLCQEYPLEYIEDPFHQDDFASFAALRAELPEKLIVGDDLYATNLQRLRRGIQERAGNTLLVKINQIGTVTEALDTARLAMTKGFCVTLSLRSNETNDPFAADFAVAIGASCMKPGPPVGGQRVAKYNRLVQIETELGRSASFQRWPDLAARRSSDRAV